MSLSLRSWIRPPDVRQRPHDSIQHQVFQSTAHSPELNPTEHLWEDIREKWFANLVFKSIAAVEGTLVKALVTLERDADRVAGLTGFEWIISTIKVAT